MNDITNIDVDAIRETMETLGDLINELGPNSSGLNKVRDEVRGGGLVGAAVRNPMSMQSIKIISGYLNQLGQEAKDALAQNPNNDVLKKIWGYVNMAYKDIQSAVSKDMESSPLVEMQTALRSLNLYAGPIGDTMTPADAGALGKALHLFRTQVGLPTIGANRKMLPANETDLQVLRKVTSNI